MRWKDDSIRRWYAREPWTSFRAVMLGQNPFCQRIQKDGKQCRNAATLVHHLISPRLRRDLFVDPANAVCLCDRCHPTDEGTPHWRPGVDYIPTQFQLPNIG